MENGHASRPTSTDEHARDDDEQDVDDGSSSDDPSSSYPPYTLDDFKADVRMWIELDDSIKTLQSALRDRRQEKVLLTKRITDFMDRHDIEDLNTKSGRIRYKTSLVRPPISQTVLKERITAFFSGDTEKAESLTRVLFDEGREGLERSSLRRMR